MPFPFTLPTTSHLTFQSHLTSPTHPSLPHSASSHRTILRSALKSHKRLPTPAAQSANLQSLLTALSTYIPYLLALDAGLSGRSICGEDIDVTLNREIEVEWRPTLSSSSLSVPGREVPRVKGRGLDYEIHSTLHTLATVHCLLARRVLLGLYVTSTTASTPEQRLAIVQSALKSLTAAHAIHLYLFQRGHSTAGTDDDPPVFPPAAVDVSPNVQRALADLAFAEATLMFVLKDDPFPALIAQARNKNDREWMIKGPEIGRVRAGLFARICVSAAERAGNAAAVLKAEEKGQIKVSPELIRYCDDLRRSCRAKACRFLGIERDAEGKTGEGIAWLRGGMAELGLDVPKSSGGAGAGAGLGSGLGKLKGSWAERREEKRLEKGKGDWGLDGGKTEEARVLEWLDQRWSKMNDTVNVQIVPDWRPLVGTMLPSGREALSSKPWVAETLVEDELARMRASPETGGSVGDDGSDSSDNDHPGSASQNRRDPVGAFPGTRSDYGQKDGSDYY